MVQINWGLLGPPADIGGSFNAGFDRATALRERAETQNALAGIATDPEDPAAISALARYQPALAIQMGRDNERRIAAQQEAEAAQQEKAAKVIGNLAKAAKTPEAWDAAVEQVAQMGYPDALQYKGRFSPETRAAIMAAAGVEEDAAKPTNLQQEYEYLKSIDPVRAEQYLERKTAENPMIASNGDGTFTIIPRSGGMAAPAPASAAKPTTEAEYQALPPGAVYIAPDGTQRTKGGAGSGGPHTFR